MKKFLEFTLGVLLIYNGLTAGNINTFGKLLFVACGVAMILIPFTKPKTNPTNEQVHPEFINPSSPYQDNTVSTTFIKPVAHPFNNYVVFDMETTGLSTKSCEIIQLAGIRVIDGIVRDEFFTLVHPVGSIPTEASKINHIEDKDVVSAPTLYNVLADFWSFVGSSMLVGYNIAKFDLPILKRDLMSELGIDINNEFVDVLKMARNANLPTTNLKLTTVADYFGIPISGAHNALVDCKITNSCFEALLTKTMPTVERANDVSTPALERPTEKDADTHNQLLSSIMYTCDNFTVDDKCICLSGIFDIGDISFVTNQIVEHGGIIKNTISNKVDYLIIGNTKNEKWKYGLYGTKLVEANKINQAGGHIVIVSENVLKDYLDL